MNSDQILNELKEGNVRFIEKKSKTREKKPAELKDGQSPHTIILTCADSRVPPELIFDQDLGDLFVIRIAGNTASDEAVGSVEYAAANLGSKVCIVLGHTSCGAVAAAVDHVQNGSELPSPCLQKVVDPIVAPVKDSLESDTILDKAIDLNITATLNELTAKSQILKDLQASGKITLHGAKYHLADGKVEFFS